MKNYTKWGSSVFLGIYSVLPAALSPLTVYVLYMYHAHLVQLTFSEQLLLVAVSVFTMGLALTPTTLTAAYLAFLIGWEGLPFMVAAYGMAAVLSRYLLKMVDATALQDAIRANARLNNYIKNIDANTWKAVFYMRLSPFLPFSLGNAFWSLQPVSLPVFLSATMVGMLPRTLLIYTAGVYASGLQEIFAGKQSSVAEWGIIAFLTLFSLYGIYRILIGAGKK